MDTMATQVVTLADIDAAAQRIKDHVRRTPCLRSRFTLNPLHRGELLLKLECLQVTGSFKARGASNAVLALDAAARTRGIITASGGNHGLAVAYASHFTGVPAVVYLPELTLAEKPEKIRAWGADVVVAGSVWDDANDAAMARAELDGLTYIAPFSDPAVIAGQGTVGREMLQQSPHIDILIVAIGGGGLISGVATAAKAIKPEITVIGVEPVGAPTLKTSVEKGRLVTLPGIDTEAVTLAPRKSAEINLDIVRRNVDDIILISDDEMREAARWLWFEAGVAAELSGAASLAALQAGRVGAPAESVVSAVVCGTGLAGLA